MVGARPVLISTLPTFQPDLDILEASITDKTKVIIVNSPNNPSGAVYPESTLREIARIAAKHNVLIISDEIYEQFTYGTPHFSIGSIYPNTITMNGFSKEYAMTGWRIGYIAGPQEIITAINELQQYIVMSSSSIAQHAAIAALKQKPAGMLDKYQKKRDFVTARLRELGIRVEGSQGAFYTFIKAPHDLTDLEYVERASTHGLVLVPGRAFSQSHGYIRISYGADMETVKKGLEIIETIAKEMQ